MTTTWHLQGILPASPKRPGEMYLSPFLGCGDVLGGGLLSNVALRSLIMDRSVGGDCLLEQIPQQIDVWSVQEAFAMSLHLLISHSARKEACALLVHMCCLRPGVGLFPLGTLPWLFRIRAAEPSGSLHPAWIDLLTALAAAIGVGADSGTCSPAPGPSCLIWCRYSCSNSVFSGCTCGRVREDQL